MANQKNAQVNEEAVKKMIDDLVKKAKEAAKQ